VTGSCSTNSALGDVYQPVTTTFDGRWYYLCESSGLYLYFDRNCGGGTDGDNERWVFGSGQPSTTAPFDLDADGGCDDQQEASIADDGTTPPLGMSAWSVLCDGSFETVGLILAVPGDPSARPTASPTSTPVPSVSARPTMRPTTPPYLLVTGSCSDQEIDDLYVPVGTTLDGRWYYEGQVNGGVLYFDQDCNGGTDSTDRWIFDYAGTEVSITAEYDLDGTVSCSYMARIYDDGMDPPLGTNAWRVNCDGWDDVYLVVTQVEAPTVSPSSVSLPAPTASPTSTPVPSVTMHPTQRPTVPSHLQVTMVGSCTDEPALNDVYAPVGTTLDGRWYYAGQLNGGVIYFEHDCNGGDDSTDRWIIDIAGTEVSTTADYEIDETGSCSHMAHIYGDGTSPPLGTNTWRLDCDSWTDVEVSIVEGSDPSAVPTPAPSTTSVPTVTPAPALVRGRFLGVTGACAESDVINGIYSPVSRTNDGRWYYEGQVNGVDLYFDRLCNGCDNADRWIFDYSTTVVSTTAEYDLDGDEACAYLGRITNNTIEPPLGTNVWRLNCDGWTDVDITVTVELSLNPTAQPTATPVPSATLQPTPNGDYFEVTGACAKQDGINDASSVVGTTKDGR
jgi:hypothetical protein